MGRFATALVLLVLAGGPVPARALDWSWNYFVALHGGEFKLGPPTRSQLGWTHLSAWRYGDTFLFVNFIRREDIGAEYYGEANTFLSLDKVFGGVSELPLVQDVALGVGLNAGAEAIEKDFTAWLFGGKAVLDVPWMQHFHVQVWAYKSSFSESWGTQVTPVWNWPIEIGRHRIVFRGFMDFRSAAATGGVGEVFGEPELLIDLGRYLGIADDRILVGTRFDFAANKFGVRDVDETAWSFMLALTL